jgi:hypothetical protein
VQQLTGEVLASDVHLYELPKRCFNTNWGKKQPSAASDEWPVLLEAQKDVKKPVEINKTDTGKYYLRKGAYVLELEKDGKKAVKEFTVE